eukprot:3282993-Alexandrium_andersonii.AAC.1
MRRHPSPPPLQRPWPLANPSAAPDPGPPRRGPPLWRETVGRPPPGRAAPRPPRRFAPRWVASCALSSSA